MPNDNDERRIHDTNAADDLDEDLLDDDDDDDFDPQEYDTMLQLERLESLEEEMMEMGVTTLEDVRSRIADLHHQLDAEDRAKRH